MAKKKEDLISKMTVTYVVNGKAVTLEEARAHLKTLKIKV